MFSLSVKECQLKLLVHYAPLIFDILRSGVTGSIGGRWCVCFIGVCLCVYVCMYVYG